MSPLQIACAVIVALYLVVRLRIAPEPMKTARRLVLLAVASWVGEDSVIHAYGFYQYNPQWWLFVDRVPLFIVVIWPIVIESAHALAGRLLGEQHRLRFLATGAMVLADASLIEPIAVRAGLWSWNEPGLFLVPPIGIFGWALFAAAAVAWLDAVDRGRIPRVAEPLVILVGPAAAHVLLVASWWALFRWVNVPLSPWPFVAAAWVISLGLAVRAVRGGAALRVPAVELLVRVPAASLFFVLLAVHGRDAPALVAYAVAFAPPYFALLAGGAGGNPFARGRATSVS